MVFIHDLLVAYRAVHSGLHLTLSTGTSHRYPDALRALIRPVLCGSLLYLSHDTGPLAPGRRRSRLRRCERRVLVSGGGGVVRGDLCLLACILPCAVTRRDRTPDVAGQPNEHTQWGAARDGRRERQRMSSQSRDVFIAHAPGVHATDGFARPQIDPRGVATALCPVCTPGRAVS